MDSHSGMLSFVHLFDFVMSVVKVGCRAQFSQFQVPVHWQMYWQCGQVVD